MHYQFSLLLLYYLDSCGCCENIISVTSPVSPLTFCVGSPGATSACKCSDEKTDAVSILHL